MEINLDKKYVPLFNKAPENISLSRVAKLLTEAYASGLEELSSDKVGYDLHDAVQLEVILLQAKEILQAKQKTGYKPSNVKRLLQRIEDDAKTETRAVTDVLNDISLTAKQILTMIKEK